MLVSRSEEFCWNYGLSSENVGIVSCLLFIGFYFYFKWKGDLILWFTLDHLETIVKQFGITPKLYHVVCSG